MKKGGNLNILMIEYKRAIVFLPEIINRNIGTSKWGHLINPGGV